MMQGDIFQLHQIQDQCSRDYSHDKLQGERRHEPNRNEDDNNRHLRTLERIRQTPLVAIYNEDDLSHFLYLQVQPVNNLHAQGQLLKLNAVTNLAVQTQAYPSTATTTALPNSPCLSNEDSDSCAVFTDEEDDECKATHHETHHPIVHHVITSTCHDFAKNSKDDHETAYSVGGGALRRHPTILPTRHSWEVLEAARLATSDVKDKSRTEIPASDHVSAIEGQLMSWWPAPMNMLEYDWNEKFYE